MAFSHMSLYQTRHCLIHLPILFDVSLLPIKMCSTVPLTPRSILVELTLDLLALNSFPFCKTVSFFHVLPISYPSLRSSVTVLSKFTPLITLTCKHQSLTIIFVPHLKIVFLEDMNQALCLILL